MGLITDGDGEIVVGEKNVEFLGGGVVTMLWSAKFLLTNNIKYD